MTKDKLGVVVGLIIAVVAMVVLLWADRISVERSNEATERDCTDRCRVLNHSSFVRAIGGTWRVNCLCENGYSTDSELYRP